MYSMSEKNFMPLKSSHEKFWDIYPMDAKKGEIE